MQEVTIPVRVIYTKTGRARYISHLDTMRSLTRALRRTDLPLWYTQGFNPHLYMTFLLPLALGVESLCEIVDLRLTQAMEWDAFKAKISECLPPGFEVSSVGAPILPAKSIGWAEYRLELAAAPGEQISLADAMREMFARESINVRKKTKKGEQTVNILPYAALLEVSEDKQGACCVLRLAAGTSVNVSPRLVLEALAASVGRPLEGRAILRTRVLDEQLKDFA